jgi:hypothetical protein
MMPTHDVRHLVRGAQREFKYRVLEPLRQREGLRRRMEMEDTARPALRRRGLWLHELRQRGSPVAVIRVHDSLEHGLRFMEERLNAPGRYASVGAA